MIITIIALILALAILLLAIIAVENKKLVVAIIAAGVVSLFASVLYLLLAAPDVAMTEAAIGSGLSTIIFFYVLNKIKKERKDHA
ncbi:MAG: hydrogenase subunit MbhD domain-containing protein [Bacteroidales bacterium]